MGHHSHSPLVAGIIGFTSLSHSAPEDGGNIVLTITRNRESPEYVSMVVRVNPAGTDTATQGLDYSQSPKTLLAELFEFSTMTTLGFTILDVSTA